MNAIRKAIWKRLTLFCYRRWSALDGPARRGDGSLGKPVGVPGNRDPDHPCDSYAPRLRRYGDWHDCRTDGHYLCAGCCHRETPQDEGVGRAAVALTVNGRA